MTMRDLWLIKRGPKPELHRAPFHPVIICARKKVAKIEAGATDDAAWVWEHGYHQRHCGWLLVRWNGFDVDYGSVVRRIAMPDSTQAEFHHERERPEILELVNSSVWWSTAKVPAWLSELGVAAPTDEFSVERIVDRERRANSRY